MDCFLCNNSRQSLAYTTTNTGKAKSFLWSSENVGQQQIESNDKSLHNLARSVSADGRDISISLFVPRFKNLCSHGVLAECQFKPSSLSSDACLINMQHRNWCPHKGRGRTAWRQSRLGCRRMTWNLRPCLLHPLGSVTKSQLRPELLSLSFSPLSCTNMHKWCEKL